MFKSWNKIIQIPNNLQADQDQNRAFLLKLGKVTVYLFCVNYVYQLKKTALCLSVTVFSTKELIESTIFTSPTATSVSGGQLKYGDQFLFKTA